MNKSVQLWSTATGVSSLVVFHLNISFATFTTYNVALLITVMNALLARANYFLLSLTIHFNIDISKISWLINFYRCSIIGNCIVKGEDTIFNLFICMLQEHYSFLLKWKILQERNEVYNYFFRIFLHKLIVSKYHIICLKSDTFEGQRQNYEIFRS